MHNKYLELYTQIFPVQNAKTRDGVQYEGLCPFHDDTKNSFGFRIDDGRCNCFVGCMEKGGAYDYAIKNKMDEKDARVYFVNHSNEYYTSPKSFNVKSPLPPKITISSEQLQKDVNRFMQNRRKKLHLIPKHWEEEILDQLFIGLDDSDNLVFPYFDRNNKLLGYKVHKKKTEPKGAIKNHWYPYHILGRYDHDKPLYIVEGEKDVITLLSYGFQAISVTAGANSIPKKTIEVIKYFNADITAIYDHDDAGYSGSNKIGKFIKTELPSHNVFTGNWRDDLIKGYDCTDAFTHSPTGDNFFEALDNRIEVQVTEDKITEILEEEKGFEVMRLNQFQEEPFEPQYPLIDSVMDKGTITIMAGDEGTGKSWAILSAVLSLASGVPLFDYFEIHSAEEYEDNE